MRIPAAISHTRFVCFRKAETSASDVGKLSLASSRKAPIPDDCATWCGTPAFSADEACALTPAGDVTGAIGARSPEHAFSFGFISSIIFLPLRYPTSPKRCVSLVGPATSGYCNAQHSRGGSVSSRGLQPIDNPAPGRHLRAVHRPLQPVHQTVPAGGE